MNQNQKEKCKSLVQELESNHSQHCYNIMPAYDGKMGVNLNVWYSSKEQASGQPDKVYCVDTEGNIT